jgi:hypothetical protein
MHSIMQYMQIKLLMILYDRSRDSSVVQEELCITNRHGIVFTFVEIMTNLTFTHT